MFALARPRLPVLAVCCCFSVLAALFVTPTLGDLGGDSAQYVALASSLASGEGYTDSHLPGRGLHGHYPPGLPLLLAPCVWLFGPESYWLFKSLCVLAGALGLAAAWSALRQRGGEASAVAAVAIAATSAASVLQGALIGSEAPFFLFTFLALAALERARAADRSYVAAVALATCAFLFRVAGLALLVTVAAVALRRNGRKSAPIAVVAGLVPFLFWIWSGGIAGGTWSYLDELSATVGSPSGFLAHLVSGIWFYSKVVGALVANAPFVGASPGWSLAFAVPVLVGLLRALRRPASFELFFVLTLVLAAAAPMRSFRYLTPILPLVCWYALHGVDAIASSVTRAIGRAARVDPRPVVAVAFCLGMLNLHGVGRLLEQRFEAKPVAAPSSAGPEAVGLGPVELQHWAEGWFLPPEPARTRLVRAYGDYLLLMQVLRRDLDPSAVLASRKPRLTSWLCGRPCVGLPAESEAARAVERLVALGVTHLVVDGLYRETRQLASRIPPRLLAAPAIAIRSARCIPLRGVPPAAPKRR